MVVPPARAKAVLAVAAVTAVLLAALEAGARVYLRFHPLAPIDAGQGFEPGSRVFIDSPARPRRKMTDRAKFLWFQLASFAVPKPPGTFRIFAVGESSVYQLQSGFEGLRDELETPLKALGWRDVEIINCGANSYGSHRLRFVVDEVLGYQPDLIFIYAGNNEFEEVEQLEMASPGAQKLQRALSRSALARLVQGRWLARRVSRLAEEHARRVRLLQKGPSPGRAWRHEFSPSEVKERMELFERNLSAMAWRARDRGVPVVLGTVPSNLWRPYLPKAEMSKYEPVHALIRQGRYPEAARLGREALMLVVGRHQASDWEARIVRSVARQAGAELLDIDELIRQSEPHGIPGETLFEDHCHLNAAGRGLLISALKPVILRLAAARRKPA